MKKSSKLLLTSGLVILALIIVIGIVVRMRIHPYYHLLQAPKNHKTFIQITAITSDHSTDITKSFSYKNFNRIYAEGLFNLYVRYGKTYGIKITAPKALIDEITVKQENNELQLSGIHNNKTPYTAIITTPNLKSLEIKGAASTQFSGFTLKNLTLRAKGMTSVNGTNNTIENLSLDMKGATSINLKQSNIKNADIYLKGMSSANLHMTGGYLKGEIKGMTSLTYSGQVSSQSIFPRGISSITKK